MEEEKDRWNKGRTDGTNKGQIEQEKDRWNKRRTDGTREVYVTRDKQMEEEIKGKRDGGKRR